MPRARIGLSIKGPRLDLGRTHEMLSRRLVPLSLATVLVMASGATAGASRTIASPITLVTTAGTVGKFAQDGSTLAVISFTGGNCAAIWVYSPVRAAGRRVAARCYGDGRRDVLASLGNLTVAGDRVFWTSTSFGNTSQQNLYITRPRMRPRKVGPTLEYYGLVGSVVADSDGESSTLAYAVVETAYDPPDCENEPPPTECKFIRSGVVRSVDARLRTVRIPGVPPSTLLSVAAGRLLVVPVREESGVRPPPEIRGAVTGRLVSRIRTSAPVRDVALTARHAVVLVGPASTPAIEVYDISSGALTSRLRVPRGAGALSASGADVAFRVGRDLFVLDARTRRSTRIHRAQSIPIGLSIEGRRIAWTENVGNMGRVRAIMLPAP